MRNALKLAFVMAAAIAALAMTASSASAVELTEEGVGHCAAVTAPNHDDGSGGCLIAAQSQGQVELGNPLGMILCDNTFEARADEDGVGYIYAKDLTNCNIPTEPCEEAGGGNEVWPVNLNSTTQMEARFCVVVAGAVVSRCHLLVDVNQVSHDQVVFQTGTGEPAPHRGCEVAGTSVGGRWIAESDANHPAIEITP